MLRNYLKITWKVLKRKKVYTFVTLIGIIIPVTFIVIISSFLVHLNNFNSPKSNFEEVVYLDNITWKEIRADGSQNQSNGQAPNYAFIQNYVKTLHTPKLVSAVSRNNGMDIIYLNGNPNEVTIKCADSEFWNIADFNFMHGRPFNRSEFDQGDKVMVIDEKTSNTIFGTADAVGKSVEIKNKLFTIIGVVENVDITMFRISANMYIPFSCIDNYLDRTYYRNSSTGLILVNKISDFQEIEKEFQQKLKTVSFEHMGNLNRIEASIKKDNYIERIQDLAQTFFRAYGDPEKPLLIIGTLLFFFFIVLPAVNLVNININRVYERFSEIGIRKTFGATTGKLIAQFMFENTVIVLAGGILSILLSWLIITIINEADAFSGIYLSINFKTVIISLLAILMLSVLSGIMPSIGMARTKIIQSLSNSK
jgi:putative ABC transport system permease protein